MDRIAKYLLSFYIFLIPFEHILEIFYGIETVFKPYRVVAMFFVVFTLLFFQKKPLIRDSTDLLLYVVIGIGLIVSVVRSMIFYFDWDTFWNNIIQTFLYLLVFFSAKRLKWGEWDFLVLMGVLVSALLINNIYGYLNFVSSTNLIYNRVEGFMDNPNYFALGNCVILIFSLLVLTNLGKSRLISTLIGTMLAVFSVFCVVISGSRTSLIITIVILSWVYFIHIGLKARLVLAAFFFCSAFLIWNSESILERLRNTPLFFRVLVREQVENRLDEDVRVMIWHGGLNAATDTYFTGLGRAQFLSYYNFRKYLWTVNRELATRGQGLGLHNDYINILVEYGSGAFIIYLFYWLKLLSRLRVRIRTLSGRVGAIVRSKYLMLISLLLFSFFSVTSLNPLYWIILFIVSTDFTGAHS